MLASSCFVLALVVATTGGCAGTPTPTTGDSGGNVGVLVSTWIIQEPSEERVARALNEFADLPVGTGPAFVAAAMKLRAAGLRPLLIPAGDLSRVLGVIGGEWDRRGSLLEQSPRWSAALSGTPWASGRTVRFNDGPVNLGPGRLRLLLRSWIAPGELVNSSPDPGFSAVVRVAIVIQHEEPPRPPDSAFVLRPPQLRRIEDDGQIFASLSLEISIPRGQVLLLVPELPDSDWSKATQGDSGPTNDTEQPQTGPPKPEIRSVGEYLLGDATDLRRWTHRTILVLAGQAPERYELLPRP